jgi:hypothetical protein
VDLWNQYFQNFQAASHLERIGPLDEGSGIDLPAWNCSHHGRFNNPNGHQGHPESLRSRLQFPLLSLSPTDIPGRSPSRSTHLPRLPDRQLPQWYTMHRASYHSRHTSAVWWTQLARMQALAARSLQEGRALRVSTRVQPQKDAGMQLLHEERLLLEWGRMPLPTHRPIESPTAVPTLRHRLLPFGAALCKEACSTKAMPFLPGRILSRWARLQGWRTPKVEKGSREAKSKE